MKIKYSTILINLLIVISMAITFSSAGQDDISIYGVVRDHADNKKIPNVDIVIYENGKRAFSKKTNLNGKYDFVLEFNKSYKIVYLYPNYVSKFLTIDAKDVPDIDRIGGFEMNIDMTLFKEIEGLDVSLLKDPIGKAQFDASKGEMAWDMAYTNMMQRKIRELMRKHDEKIVEEEERVAKVRDNFDNLVRLGDAGVRNKKYDNAIGYYTEALFIIPDDEVVTQKLEDAKASAAKFTALQERKSNYNEYVKQGDSYFNRKEWSSALTAFEAANELFPEESYPQVKIEDINKKLDAERNMAKVNAQIMALLMEGDKLISIEEYDSGIEKYQEVLTLDANHEEAKRKLAEAKKKREAWLKQRDLDAQYLAYVAQADEDFNQEKYETAVGKYRNASNIKPSEKYPQDQIKKAEEFLSLAKAEAAKNKAFQEFVDKGDNKISKKEYQPGIDFYNQALGIIPDDEAVKVKIKNAQDALAAIAEEEEALRQKKELDDQFANFVKQGDNSFNSKNYLDAIGFYEKALELKPANPDVEAKIAESRKAMNDLLASKQIDEKYAEAIREADKDFKNLKYEAAVEFYQQASALKPKEDYPKNKLLEIDAIIARIAADDEAKRLKEIEDQFAAFVLQGDEYAADDNFDPAIGSYEKALGIKPDNAEVKAKIEDVKNRQKEKLASLAIDEQYDLLIGEADKLFRSQNWENAKTKYKDAYELKNEQYPLEQIDKIDVRLAALAEAELKRSEAEKQLRFEKLEKEGDNAVSANDYTGGIGKYDEALLIFSDNQRVIDKKRNAEKLMAEANSKKDIDDRYNRLIADADAEFDGQDYTNARSIYQQAINLKAEESYPKKRIDEIDLRLLELANNKEKEEIKARFDELEANGDSKVAAAEYLEAIDNFEQALEIFPDNSRVQQKVVKARRMFKSANSARELDAQYNEFIDQADAQFNTEEYKKAKRNYQQAFALKPMDYPKKRIAEIDILLLEFERRNAEAEAARLAEMQDKKKDLTWEENTSDEEQYIIAARNANKSNEELKYAELLAYKEALKRTRDGYVVKGDDIRSTNNAIVNEQKENGDELYDQIKKEDDLRQIAEVAMVKEMEKNWTTKMIADQRNRAGTDTQAEDYKQYQKDLNSKHREVILKNYDETQQLAEVRYKKFGEYEDSRLKNIEEVKNNKENLKSFYSTNSDEQLQRIKTSTDISSEIKETKSEYVEKGDEIANSNYSNLQSEDELRKMETEVWKDKSQIKREIELEEINHTKWPGEKDPYDYVETDKSRSYKQGVTEETYDEGNNKVVKRMVVKGNKVDEYKMVVTNHGTYYFKNGSNITKATWNTSTENVSNSD